MRRKRFGSWTIFFSLVAISVAGATTWWLSNPTGAARQKWEHWLSSSGAKDWAQKHLSGSSISSLGKSVLGGLGGRAEHSQDSRSKEHSRSGGKANAHSAAESDAGAHRPSITHGGLVMEDVIGSKDPKFAARVPEGSKDGKCVSVEVMGRGPVSKTSPKDWAEVMKSFHKSKADYLAWLNAHRAEFGDELVAKMSAQMSDLRIQRAPTPEEPDLSWRGVVVRSHDEKGAPLVRVGDGFIAWMKSDAPRARFELARAMAQSWTPCESGSSAVWAGFFKCMGAESEACVNGKFSENAWTVATALAEQVASPGCRVPAFAGSKAQGCVSRIPSGVEWKEAHK